MPQAARFDDRVQSLRSGGPRGFRLDGDGEPWIAVSEPRLAVSRSIPSSTMPVALPSEVLQGEAFDAGCGTADPRPPAVGVVEVPP
jgi:hypothetical protein